MQSTRNLIVKRITPKCENMGSSIKTAGIILLILSILLIVFLIISVAYNQYKGKPPAQQPKADPPSNQTSASNALQIAAIILSILVAGVGIWHVIISNNYVKCVNESSIPQ